MDPGITAIMLAKNEEARMRRCLASIQGHVDTFVALVDPESTDRTADVVRQAGGRVLNAAWPGGFDAARNLCLEQVETEWILWLDADEWFDGDDASHLRELVQNADAFCFGLIRREVNEEGPQTRSQVIRLWRSRPQAGFVGVVHEHLDQDALDRHGSRGREFGTDLAFNHDGYLRAAIPQKAARYVELLEEELRRRPGQLFYEVKLACTLAVARDARAESALRDLGDRLLALSDELEEAPIAAGEGIGPILQAIPQTEWRTARSDALVRLGRAWFPRSPAVLWAAAQFEIGRQNLAGALSILMELERLSRTGDFDRRTPYLDAMVGEGLFTNLALVAHQLGRHDVARRNYERLLELDPRHPVASQNLPKLSPRGSS